MASKKSNVPAFSRMNYLYQAASMCTQTPTEQSVRLAAYYGMLLRGIGKKAQARMDPSIKRTLCKGCHMLMVPGVTATVRLQKRPVAQVTWLCKCCATIKRFNLRKGYKIWAEHEEAVVVQGINNAPKAQTGRSAAAGTSGNQTGNVKNNKSKQNKTGTVVDANGASLVPVGKIDMSVTVRNASSAANVGQCDIDSSAIHVALTDVALSNEINGSSIDTKQCDVDSTDELKDSVSDIRLSDVDVNDPITGRVKEDNVEPARKLEDRVSDNRQCVTGVSESGDVKQCNKNALTINSTVSSVDETNDLRLCDVCPSDIKVYDNNETSVMVIDSDNVNQTNVVDNGMDVDSSDTKEGVR